jgi:hypothetical protein
MPQIKVVLYKDDDGVVPTLDWLSGLPTKARDKCIKKIERLKELGHLIRRPEADYLRDNIYFFPLISFDHPPLPLQGGDYSFLKKSLVTNFGRS